MKITQKIKKRITGFTLIELLIVIGILAILFAIVLIAINPVEQFNRSADVATQSVTSDLSSSVKYFYTQKKTTIWASDQNCRNELSTQTTVDKMPNCVQQLAQDPQLQQKVTNSSEGKDISMTQCNDSLAICFKAKSNAYKNDPQAKYGRNGALNPKCPGGDDCYVCNFTTNEGQECFTALSPNAEVAAANTNTPQVLPIPDRHSENVCGTPNQSGQFSCAAENVTDSLGHPLASLASVNGLTPEQLHKAYNLPCTPGGQVDWQCDTPSTYGPRTVAIVVAYHAPTLENDLNVYSQKYGLPPCTVASGCLSIVNQNGTTSPMPSSDSLWALEASLDTQMAHAVCQTCKILVVEASSNYIQDLAAAEDRAAIMGATAINNSFAGSESYGHQEYDTHFTHPGVFIAAATGDWGSGLYYPASSKNVIAVGGTTLSIFDDFTYASETVWSGSGGGCSALYEANPFQTSLSNWSLTGCGTKRGVGDVAADADPRTGASIYTSTGYGGSSGWMIVGGTSESSPIVAAALTLQADQNPGVGASYIYSNPTKFRDILVGSNGGCSSIMCRAGNGYDGPTGIGSPNWLPSGGVTPTIIPTTTPTPTPTPMGAECNTAPTVTTFALTTGGQYYPAIPGDILELATNTKDNDPSTCSSIFHQSYKYPADWQDFGSVLWRTNSLPLQGGYTIGSNITIGIPFTTIPGIFNYTNLVEKVNTTTEVTASGQITVVASPPTDTTSYYGSPDSCGSGLDMSLNSNVESVSPGSTVSNILTVHSKDATSCSVTYTLGSTPPTSIYISGLPSSFTLTGGQTKVIPFNITASSYNMVHGNYVYYLRSYWSGTSRQQGVHGRARVSQASSQIIPSETPTITPSTTPQDCSAIATLSLSQPSIQALPKSSANNILTIKNNNASNCGSVTFTISRGYPLGWSLGNLPSTATLVSGETKSFNFYLILPEDKLLAQDYAYEIWASYPGQTLVNPTRGIIHVTQASPTDQPTPTLTSTPSPSPTSNPSPTPTPIPQNCSTQQTVSLQTATPIQALPGDTVNNTLIVTSNDSPGCSALYTISYGYPTGWGLNGIPPSFTLAGGATKNIPITITVPVSGLSASTYSFQFWVAKQGQSSVNPVNGYVQITQASPTNTPTPSSAPTPTFTPSPTPTLYPTKTPIDYNGIVPGYGIDQSKFFKTYAVYFFDYPGFAPSGAGWNMQISTKSDFSASYPDQLTSYGIPDSYGQDAPLNDSYAALRAITHKYVGFASIVPYDYNKNHCGQTIYWRITNFYNPSATNKLYGPTYTGIIDCTTKVNVVDPPLSWYTVFNQGGTNQQIYYEPAWDFDKNGVIDWTDYWLGAFSTKFRSGGWQPPE